MQRLDILPTIYGMLYRYARIKYWVFCLKYFIRRRGKQAGAGLCYTLDISLSPNNSFLTTDYRVIKLIWKKFWPFSSGQEVRYELISGHSIILFPKFQRVLCNFHRLMCCVGGLVFWKFVKIHPYYFVNISPMNNWIFMKGGPQLVDF